MRGGRHRHFPVYRKAIWAPAAGCRVCIYTALPYYITLPMHRSPKAACGFTGNSDRFNLIKDIGNHFSGSLMTRIEIAPVIVGSGPVVELAHAFGQEPFVQDILLDFASVFDDGGKGGFGGTAGRDALGTTVAI